MKVGQVGQNYIHNKKGNFMAMLFMFRNSNGFGNFN